MLEIHVYKGFFGTERIDQILEISNVEIEENIDSFNILNFRINYAIDDFGNSNVKNITDYTRIKLVEVDNLEVTLFDGVVVTPIPKTTYMDVTARDLKGLLLKKIIVWDKAYTGSSLSSIMGDIIWELNGRSSSDTIPESWTVTIDTDITSIDIEFSDGDNYFDTITKLCNQEGKNWKVNEGGEIYIADIIGSDKTTGSDFTQLLYDYKTPDENTIAEYEQKSYGTLANYIRHNDTSIESEASIEIFNGRLEEYSTLDTTEIQAYLDKVSQRQLEYTFELNFSRLETDLKLGDRVSVKIDTAVDTIDFSGSLTVTKLKKKYEWSDTVYLGVDVSDIIIVRDSFVDNLNKLFTDVKNLKLQ